jgi:NAD(P)-dependent dehydrogenase (short-subunit alcohol dehydrogenase family)
MTAESARIAVVTGGGTGLGQACVLRLLADGYRVYSLGLDVEQEIDDPRHLHIPFDVTDTAAINDFAKGFDGVDALINAAGIIQHEGREWSINGFRKVMDVNLFGTQEMCFAFGAALKARGGAVVNFASMWSIFGSGRNPGYSASKGAVASFTRALASAWAGSGIRVNAVAPGWIDTRMSVNAMTDPGRSGPILARIPAGRWGAPREVANVVGFLVSPSASYVNGVVLPIDGGYSIA